MRLKPYNIRKNLSRSGSDFYLKFSTNTQTHIRTILLYWMFQFMFLSCFPSEETALTNVKVETL